MNYNLKHTQRKRGTMIGDNPSKTTIAELKGHLSASFSEKRKGLRAMAMPILEREIRGASRLEDVVRDSPIIGNDERTQINVKPTVSSFIMNMCTEALLHIVVNDKGAEQVLKAIKMPDHHDYGMYRNSSTKTGYDFGRPKALSNVNHSKRVATILEDDKVESYDMPSNADWKTIDGLEIEEHSPDKWGMQQLMDIIAFTANQIFIDDKSYSLDLIVDEMCNVLENLGVSFSDEKSWTKKADALRVAMEDHSSIEVFIDSVKGDTPFTSWKEICKEVSEVSPTAIEGSGTKRDLFSHLAVNLREKGSIMKPSTASEDFSYDSSMKSSVELADMALKQLSLPSVSVLVGTAQKAKDLQTEIEEMSEKLKRTSMMPVSTSLEVKSTDGVIPNGKKVIKKAHEVFNIVDTAKRQFDFDIVTWEWEGEHPHVPPIDPNYIFRPASLLRVLYAINTNQRAYLSGHTGSGKTTLVEQICARMFYPFMRVNFDSEITRMDLIGRDVLAEEGGVTTSKFIDGILPQMMSSPCIGCFDELDFVRPDVAYVMQRGLEGNGLMLTEDGGRMVMPHPDFRMIATGNTVGQGDEFGMYQGARPQSMALIDRFTVWINVPYMGKNQRDALIKAKVPSLSKQLRDNVNKYIEEHLEAFTTSKVLQPLSPRGFLSLSNAIVTFTSLMPDEKAGIEQALEATILDRCSQQDKAVLKGIINRIFTGL